MQASSSSPSLSIVHDPQSETHRSSGFHPERPERLPAALRGIQTARISTHEIAPVEATIDQLSAVHDTHYLQMLDAALARGHGFLDGDTFFSAGSRRAAWRAAGSACALVDEVLQGNSRTGFLLTRPPGHHATRKRAMGFCLLNSVAIAAAHARQRGLQRVAIIDWDVHHGNGTQDIFAKDPSILFFSLHQWPLYPGTGSIDEQGEGDGRGHTINIPLPEDSNGADYAAAFDTLVLPIVEEFRPELVLISAGFDGHIRDPLAAMRLEASDYGWMARQLKTVANRLQHGRLIAILEGGYDLRALEDSVKATAEGMLEAEVFERPNGTARAEALSALQRARSAQQEYWRSVR